MSPSDSDDYQSKFNLYERALKNAKYDIKGEIDSFDSSEKGVKEELKLILPEIINENLFKDSNISKSDFEDLKLRMYVELNNYIDTMKVKSSLKKPSLKKPSLKKPSLKKSSLKKGTILFLCIE